MSKSKSVHSSQEFSSSSCTSSSVSSDEETDAQDLKPIKDYLRNRRELARQLFRSVKTDKIRMMLPQVLKKMDLDELEEWCASELSGMSKKRILAILNGKPMVDSSATSESDDSGPSLEIISDTEEWFSDEDICKTEEGTGGGKVKIKKDKSKPKGKAHEKNDIEKSKAKGRAGHKDKISTKYKDVKVKTENEKETNKEKEGDSLLDLLELEMRARAIRALIRKEEDVIPGTNSSQSSTKESSNSSKFNKTMQDEMQEKESCQQQLEKIISVQQGSIGEDEDVVLVVQPTPTIELLSSESEGEGHSGARVNKKLENERVMRASKEAENKKNENQDNTGSPAAEPSKQGTDETPAKEKSGSKHKISAQCNNDVNKKVNQESIAGKTDCSTEKRRKVKKKSSSKEHQKSSNSTEEDSKSKLGSIKQNTDGKLLNSSTKSANSREETSSSDSKTVNNQPEQASAKTQGASQKVVLDEEKSTDLEEIIDLDDYCDDMEDMENYDNDKNKAKDKKHSATEQQKAQTESCQSQKQNSAETWASRYYQTDDVQNVIKESKIQSEIRKRLRERQRLSKLNKSPNTTPPSAAASVEPVTDTKPTGSVDEYLALKRTSTISLSSANNNEKVNVEQNQNMAAESATASIPSENENLNKQTTVPMQSVSAQSSAVPRNLNAPIDLNNQVNPG